MIRLAAIVAAILLAGCGGLNNHASGGGGGAPGPAGTWGHLNVGRPHWLAQLPPAGDVAADAEAGAGAATTALVGLVLGAAGLLVGLVALGMAFAGRRRTA